MTDLVEQPIWEPGIYQWETNDPVEGGPEGIDNKPTRQLANRTVYLKQEQDNLKEKFNPEKTPDPLSQYLTRNDFIKMNLGMVFPSSFVGHDPDPNYYIPSGRVVLNRNEYQTVFDIVQGISNFISQDVIDADPRAYAGYWGDGDGITTFTTNDIALLMNIKVSGPYGAPGTTKEDHIQNITASSNGLVIRGAGNEDDVVFGGAFHGSPQALGTIYGATQLTARSTIYFDASRVARTSDFTDTMGVFLDHWRFIPKGEFSL